MRFPSFVDNPCNGSFPRIRVRPCTCSEFFRKDIDRCSSIPSWHPQEIAHEQSRAARTLSITTSLSIVRRLAEGQHRHRQILPSNQDVCKWPGPTNCGMISIPRRTSRRLAYWPSGVKMRAHEWAPDAASHGGKPANFFHRDPKSTPKPVCYQIARPSKRRPIPGAAAIGLRPMRRCQELLAHPHSCSQHPMDTGGSCLEQTSRLRGKPSPCSTAGQSQDTRRIR